MTFNNFSHLFETVEYSPPRFHPMKRKVYISCLTFLAAICAHAQSNNNPLETMKTVSCKLTTPELQERKMNVIAELKKLVLSRQELANGYRYTFDVSDEILDKLTTFIKTERMCCDFFTFQLTVEENVATLTLTGPEGTKEFIEHEIDI
jgi:hypothetical protein